MIIRKIKNEESDECEIILRALPEWFGIESSIIEYVEDIKKMEIIIAEIDNKIVGFLALNHHNQYTSEIHVMGIKKEFHNQGIGKELVKYIEKILSKDGYEFLEVKTLGESHPDKNYAKTRQFYHSVGFRPIEVLDLWGPDNPCLLMIKKL